MTLDAYPGQERRQFVVRIYPLSTEPSPVEARFLPPGEFDRGVSQGSIQNPKTTLISYGHGGDLFRLNIQYHGDGRSDPVYTETTVDQPLGLLFYSPNGYRIEAETIVLEVKRSLSSFALWGVFNLIVLTLCILLWCILIAVSK